MSNSLSKFDPFQTKTDSKSLFNALGRGLGKVAVFARQKVSGLSQAIHQSIEGDVERRLCEQSEYQEMLLQQQELEYSMEISQLKRNYRIKLFLTFVLSLGIGFIASAIYLNF